MSISIPGPLNPVTNSPNIDTISIIDILIFIRDKNDKQPLISMKSDLKLVTLTK